MAVKVIMNDPEKQLEMLGYIKGTAVIQTEKCWIPGRKGDRVDL